MPPVEPHVFAVVTSSSVASNLLDFMPECDIAEELKTIIGIQHEILCEMIQGRHFGSTQLDDFIKYLAEIQENIEGLKKCH